MNTEIKPGVFYDADTMEPFVPHLIAASPTTFTMNSRLFYLDHQYNEPFVVPCDNANFETDLGSIPWMVAWTLPKFGAHLPAFLLHDALVLHGDQPRCYSGPVVDRTEADRIMRDAMGELGSSRIRRWMAWSGVSLMSFAKTGTLKLRLVIAYMFISILVIGTLATFQLFGIGSLLPWMMSDSFIFRLLDGAALAIAWPLAISGLWSKHWKVGAIAGVGLALLMHVTALVLLITFFYKCVERITGS